MDLISIQTAVTLKLLLLWFSSFRKLLILGCSFMWCKLFTLFTFVYNKNKDMPLWIGSIVKRVITAQTSKAMTKVCTMCMNLELPSKQKMPASSTPFIQWTSCRVKNTYLSKNEPFRHACDKNTVSMFLKEKIKDYVLRLEFETLQKSTSYYNPLWGKSFIFSLLVAVWHTLRFLWGSFVEMPVVPDLLHQVPLVSAAIWNDSGFSYPEVSHFAWKKQKVCF